MTPRRTDRMLAVALRDRLRDVTAEPHAVVGPTILRIDLRRVRDEDSGSRRLERQETTAVANSRHRLRGGLAEGPVTEHVLRPEGPVHELERGEGGLQQRFRSEARQGIVLRDGVGRVEGAGGGPN